MSKLNPTVTAVWAAICLTALAAAETPPLVRIPHRGKGLEGRFHPTYASAHAPETSRAKDVPPFLRGAVMYQLFTRMFTPEGTFAAARAKLPDLKADGVDIVYPRRTSWPTTIPTRGSGAEDRRRAS